MQITFISLVLCCFLALCVNGLPVRNDSVANTTINDRTDSNNKLTTTIGAEKFLFKNLLRNRRSFGGNRYADRDDYYEDRDDDIGYDRQGSDVGYMSRHDDFPTVVW